MSDFLTRLIARTKGTANVAQPVIPPVFAQVPGTLSNNVENSMQEPLDGSVLASPSNYFAPRKPDQPFREVSNDRFAPPEHIKSPLSEKYDSDFPHQKKNFSAINESSINKVISEIDQNTGLLPEHSPDVKKDFSGRLIDSEHSGVPQKIPETEEDQKIDTQLNHSPGEKRDASRALIKSENVMQQGGQTQRDLKISLQPEHSLNDIQDASPEINNFKKTNTLRRRIPSIEVQSTMTSHLEPYDRIRIKQNAKPEESESTIKVTIGHVEVRAIMPQSSKPQAQRPRTHQILSLDDYLKRRNERGQ